MTNYGMKFLSIPEIGGGGGGGGWQIISLTRYLEPDYLSSEVLKAKTIGNMTRDFLLDILHEDLIFGTKHKRF